MKARDDKPHINRAEKHINGFIRVFVSLADGVEFPMLVDRSMTMEYVARQVEAELWALRTPRKPLDAPDDWKASMEQLIAVYQLYDIAQVAYPFDGIAADCLKFDDQITPLTSLEGILISNLDSFPEEDDLFLLSNSAFELNTDKQNNTLQASTAEERLHSILTNTCSLQFFLQFSLAEYSVENSLFWIEIELFRSLVSAQDRIIFDRHIRNTFIEKNAPLALNIDEETRNTNLHQSGSLDGKKYDELQDFIFLLIKTHGYSRFQNSLLFQKFLEFRDKGSLLVT